ncbi:heavy-metal-associated domain-containing protein [Sphingomonas sp.]|uniref:heavy-metal-associated domain-containing protein n=1 Tax=Sphingomonas sp. TaxID=28214 RepID=UPI002FCC081D
MKLLHRLSRPLPMLLGLATAAAAAVVYAQLEGGDRGVPPIDSASTYEVTGVTVDVAAPNAEAARYEGWRLAQAKGWKALWASTNHRPQSEAPNLPDSVLNSIVSGVIIENEDIGPQRYLATLGVLFDRARTGQLLGGSQGQIRRSAPMLVIPVMITGSTAQVFESRTEWQKAWARFRTGNTPIDYVRPVGSGIDPLLLNAPQTRRPGRSWWRMLLDQYGAADILVPEVQLKRLYPGGPVIGTFTARHGPDNLVISRFGLRVERSTLIPKLLDEGARRIDAAYARALQNGLLAVDPSLTIEEPPLPTDAEQIENAASELGALPTGPIPMGVATTYLVQVDTPTSASVGQAELAVSRIGGVTSAITTSLALGGTSVMRVTFTGDPAALQAALQAQGFTVQTVGNVFSISRRSAAPPTGRE